MADIKTADVERVELERADGAERASTRPVYPPAVDIIEREGDVLLLADMPGVEEKSLEIMLEKNVLSIKGTITPPRTEGHGLAYQEFEEGDYHRAFTLSNDVAPDGIQATLRNGVLSLVLPKAAPARARKIEVKG